MAQQEWGRLQPAQTLPHPTAGTISPSRKWCSGLYAGHPLWHASCIRGQRDNLFYRSSELIIIFRSVSGCVCPHASCRGRRVRALGSTVEAILSSSKHPDLLQQLLDNVDSLQKAR